LYGFYGINNKLKLKYTVLAMHEPTSVENWWNTTEVFGEKPVPLPFCPP
jgi:hypothetical protein